MTPFHYSACPPATTTASDVIRSGIGDKSELIKLQDKSYVTVVLHNTKNGTTQEFVTRVTISMMLLTKKNNDLVPD